MKEVTITDTVPRTANLLACRQWWKVCFLYGDQEKYYRQIYGKAASQRLASSQRLTSPQRVIYPTKLLDPVVLNGSPPRTIESRKRARDGARERTVPHSRVTVLDDPFLFGLEHDYGSDSGIDANSGKGAKASPSPPSITQPVDPPKPILKNRIAVKKPDYNQPGLPCLADLERVRHLSSNRNRNTICDVSGIVENAMMGIIGNHDKSDGLDGIVKGDTQANEAEQFSCNHWRTSGNNAIETGVGYGSLPSPSSKAAGATIKFQ